MTVIVREPITLRGRVLGRAVRSKPVNRLGLPMAASSDKDVTLTLELATVDGGVHHLQVPLTSLPRGWLEIDAAVVVTISEAVP